MHSAECFGQDCSQSVSLILSGVSVSPRESISETPPLGHDFGAPVSSQPADLPVPHSAHLRVRPGLGRVSVSRLVQGLHAAVGVVASCWLLGDPRPQHLPLHYLEATACVLWSSCTTEGEAADFDYSGSGVGGKPGLLNSSFDI